MTDLEIIRHRLDSMINYCYIKCYKYFNFIGKYW